MGGRFENFTPPTLGSELTTSEMLLIEGLNTLSNSTAFQFLQKVGGVVVNTSIAELLALTNLSDVAITSPTSGQILTYNGSSWINSSSTAGTGTVTSVAVTTANGVSATVTNATTAAALSFTLGAITPTTVNGLTITANGTNTLSITAGKTLSIVKTMSFTAADDTGVYTLPTGTKTLLATDGSAASLTSFPTFNQNTSGSAASLSVSGQTGLITLTGIASTSRIKTVRDAADTILELGGSYTPTGTWTSLTMVTPALGTPASGTLTNATGYLFNNLTAPSGATSITFAAGRETTFTYSLTTQTGILQTSTTLTSGIIEKLSVTGSSVIATSASSGFLLTLTSAGTGMTGATQRMAAFYSTGANGTASVVLQGLDISIANTGTTNTNQALRLSASGGSTTNIALDLAAGELRLAGAAGTSGQILISGGANASPSWTSTPTVTTLTTTGNIELGHASDTSLVRVSAGVVSIEGSNIMTVGSTDTVTGIKTMSGIVLPDQGYIRLVTPTTDLKATGTTTSDYVSGYSSTAIGDLVYLDSSAKWQKCDANTLALYNGLLGIALTVSAADAACTVALPGSFIYSTTGFPTWTIGSPIYMSETAGAMTHTAPTTTDAAIRIVGWGVHADKMYFFPSPDYTTHT